MEAIEMVLLIMLVFIVGTTLTALFFRRESREWRKQVDDERTRD